MSVFNPILATETAVEKSERVQKMEARQEKFQEYLQILEVMGRIRPTRGHYGYSRNVSKKTFEDFLSHVPKINEEHQGIYRSQYETENGEERFLLVIGHKANPDDAVDILISAGVESPAEIKERIERKSYFD